MRTLIPKGREKIFEFILNNPEKELRIRELARELKLSPAYVSRTLKWAKKQGIVKKNKANLSNSLARAIKIFLNIKKITERKTVQKLKKLGINGTGIYGSWANGTNTEDSDLDIWIKTGKKLSEAKIATVAGEMRKALGTNTQILVLDRERMEKIKQEDPVFYYSLLFGSIILFGEPIE